jgi:hypothetical protein
MAKTYKGYFKPNNPSKYNGDPSNIIYRSRWEAVFMSYLDKNSNVIKWSSEELIIPYRSKIDGRIHRYFPDFWVKKLNKEGKQDVVVIEIKPYAQTLPPKKQDRITKKYLYEVKTYGVNKSKWEAAEEYCKDRGWDFAIVTEKELKLKF